MHPRNPRSGSPREDQGDLRDERFLVHSLQIAIQAAIDVASHVVSDERLGEPRTNRELFMILARNGWLPAALERNMANMTGFRNIIVHGYEAVNLDIVKDIADNHLDDLLAFVGHIRGRPQGQ